MSATASPARRRRAPLRARLLAVAVLLVVGACTGSTADGPTGAGPSSGPSAGLTTPPDTSTPTAVLPPAPVRLDVARGADAGAAAGRSVTIPTGWSAQVWSDVPGARMAAWTPDGRLVVSSGDHGTVWLLSPGTDPAESPTTTVLLDGLSHPQGVAFARQGGVDTLVVGEDSRIVAWTYADGTVSDRRVLVDRLPTSGHGAKAVAVSGTTVFYSLGSAGNRDPADRDTTPARATVWQVDLDGTGNRTVATGVRNGFGLAIAPDGTLFTAVNQADNQPYPYQDDTDRYGRTVAEYVNENPVDQVSRITPGTDLGWPYCVPDTRGRDELVDLPYVNDPTHNPGGEQLDCTAIGTTMLGLPAHSAPLGLTFTTGSPLEDTLGLGALVTTHGSWNREPPRAPGVAFSPWDPDTATLGPPIDLVTGFQDPDGSRWGRTVDAVPGPDGSLYVTDDEAGLVYRVTPGS